MSDEDKKASDSTSDKMQSSGPPPPVVKPDDKSFSGGLNRVVKKLDEHAYKTITDLDTLRKDGEKIPQSSSAQKQDSEFMPPPPPPGTATSGPNRVAKKTEEHAFKTKLDLDACRKVTEEIAIKKEAENAAKVRTTPSETFRMVKPIDQCRAATHCKAKWEDMSGTDSFKICRQCGLHVYNFSNVSLSAAKELIMQREGIENPTFYRREDGKFLTKDCPVGAKEKGTTAAMVAVGSVVVIAVIAAISLAPRLSPQRTETGQTSVTGQTRVTVKPGGSTTKSMPLRRIQVPLGIARSTSVSAPAAHVPSNMLRKFKPMLNNLRPQSQPSAQAPVARFNSSPGRSVTNEGTQTVTGGTSRPAPGMPAGQVFGSVPPSGNASPQTPANQNNSGTNAPVSPQPVEPSTSQETIEDSSSATPEQPKAPYIRNY